MHNKQKKRFKPTKTVSGILLMMLHAIAMSVIYVMGKPLSHTLDPAQLTFLYKIVILVGILPWVLSGGIKKNLNTKRIGIHAARGAFSFLGTLCFFMALREGAVTNVAAISYLDHILVILIGFWYFKEKLNNGKLTMIFLSFIGALLLMKPGYGEFSNHYVYIILAVLFWSLNSTVIKMLGHTERTKAQLFYVLLFSSLFGLPSAIYAWQPLDYAQTKVILAIAVFYLIHYVAFFKALKYADISTVMPFEYTRLIFTGVLGLLIFNEVPSMLDLVGYSLIVAGGLYSIHYEARRNKKLTEARKDELAAEHEQI